MARSFVALLMGSSLLCAGSALAQAAPAAPSVSAARETQPTAQGGANGAVVWLGADAASARIVGSGELGGLEVYGLDGARQSSAAGGEVVGVDVRYNVPVGGRRATVFAAGDAQANTLRFYEGGLDGRLVEIGARAVPVGFALESLCLFASALDGNLYAYALGGGGEIQQFVVYASPDGRLDARPVRRLHLASEVSYCAADDATGDLYVAEQGVGVWRFPADPEAEVVPELIDARRLGHIQEEVGGLALYDGGEGARWLVVSNASAGQLNVYDRSADHRLAGRLSIAAAPGGADGVDEPTALFASSLSLGAGLPNGVLLVTDEADDAGANYKLVSFADLAGRLQLAVGAPQDPRRRLEPPMPTVVASVETVPVETDGDAADDPAVWVHPTDPSLSLVIGTQKQSGLYVYGLDGKTLQFLPDGKMNNVDLRDGFMLDGKPVSLVLASNRTDDSIAIYRVDPEARRLVAVADGVQATGLPDPYGLCLYRSRRSKKTYVFVNDTEGRMKQWELVDAGGGKVRTKLVREFAFGSQAEGCVADDETGVLYVAEEDVGLWRMSAEPKGGAARTSVAAVAANPALKDDMEGVGLYDLGGGRGYLVLSSQGNNSYAVFRREGANEYIGSFAVVADGATGIDGVSETDGLEVTSRSLGAAFPHGAMIAQDGRNVGPQEHQNFKIISWDAIAASLKLESR